MSLQSNLNDYNVDLTIDATGLNCPLPILKARKGLMQLSSGQLLRIEASDPESSADFPTFCQQTGNELLFNTVIDKTFIFILKAK